MELELCCNNEWWRVMSAVDFDGIDDAENVASDDLIAHMWDALENAGHTVTRSPGLRSTCHGWNGATVFNRFGNGIGTFDDVSGAEWDATLAVVAAAAADWRRWMGGM